MDGKALLDSLADWTSESHPNVSLEARQHNNELMADFRSELFNLLGSTTQVGGGQGNCQGGINIVQPMDEALVRELSPAELAYRLDLAEFGGGQSGGKMANIESNPEKKLGYMKRYNIWRGIRTFNHFVDDFEKLRAQINKNMAGYEAEAKRSQEIGEELVKTIRRRFLNSKLKTLWQIIKAKESALTDAKGGQIKREILVNRITRAESEETRLKIESKKQSELVKKAFFVKKTGWFKNKKTITIVDTLKSDLDKQLKAYNALNDEMNYYTKQITEAKNLKALEAAVASKPIDELTKAQRRELAQYQQNREKYEKMYGFSETKREEYERLVSKKEDLLNTLDFLNRTLVMTGYVSKSKNMEDALNEWNGLMTGVYDDLSTCIAESGKYKGDLDTLRGLITDNANNISKLISGMPEFESIKAEYDKYYEQCDKAFEYQEAISNTLGEIKNKFIELIPDKALLPDMFRVSRAQGMVLSIVEEILSKKQLELGGNYDSGMKYFDRKIPGLKGGANSKVSGFRQTGGFNSVLQLKIDTAAVPPSYDDTIVHGGTFYEHNERGQVYDCASGNYLDAANPATQVEILSLPFGVRRISHEYITHINDAIRKVDNDRLVYLPLLNVDNGEITVLLAKYFDDGLKSIRITSVHTSRFTPTANEQKFYYRITGNYYFYNIYSNEIGAAAGGAASLSNKVANGDFLTISNERFLLLPMFYKMHEVDNALFKYNEYVLLHPLFGCVMSALLSETNLTRYPAAPAAVAGGNSFATRYPAGIHFDYDFINPVPPPNPAPPALPLHLKMRTENSIIQADIEREYDYYYNFCGDEIEIKKQPAAGNPRFETTNCSAIPGTIPNPAAGGAKINPVAGALQPVNNLVNIDEYSSNRAIYANYIGQLTGHLQEFIKRIEGIEISDDTGPLTVNHSFADNSGYEDPLTKYNLNYNLAPVGDPAAPMATPPNCNGLDCATNLQQIGNGKNWSNVYQENMLDITGTDDSDLIFGIMPIKILIADIHYWIKYKTIPLKDTNKKLYDTMITAAAASAGIPVGFVVPTGAAAAGTGTAAVAPVPPKIAPHPYTDPKVIARRKFLERAIPNTGAKGSYWDNLGLMSGIIAKFKSNDYINYSNKLFKLFDDMQIIRKIEDKILDIKSDKDGFKVPEFTLIAANLEAKPATGSKDAYTAAGQKLHDKLREDKDFIAKNRSTVPSSNLVEALDEVIFKITRHHGQGQNLLTSLSTITDFQYDPANKYAIILETADGAKEFVRQLDNSRYKNDINKICLGITHLLGITKVKNQDAYQYYEPFALAAMQQIGNNKKGNRQGNRRGNRPKTRRGGGAGY